MYRQDCSQAGSVDTSYRKQLAGDDDRVSFLVSSDVITVLFRWIGTEDIIPLQQPIRDKLCQRRIPLYLRKDLSRHGQKHIHRAFVSP